MTIKVSVIVCTFNRCESLADTLHSLQEMQVGPGIEWEVVVVDNNSTDRTKEVVQKLSINPVVRMRYLFEPLQGLSHARNCGVRSSASELIAFTDDDILVQKDWLSTIVDVFKARNADCVGGRILPYWLGKRPQWLGDNLLNVLAMLDLGDEEMDLGGREENKILYGANFAFKRTTLLSLGLFNVELGRKGNVGTGEDQEIVERIKLGNGKVIYSPKAVVHHKVYPDRLSKKYFRRWYYAAGRDRAKITRNCRFTMFGIESYLFREFIRDFGSYLKAISGLTRDEAFQHEMRCILLLSIFKHKLELGKFNPWARIGVSAK